MMAENIPGREVGISRHQSLHIRKAWECWFARPITSPKITPLERDTQMRRLIARTILRIVLASLLVSLAVSLAGGTAPIRSAPKPLLAIDCGSSQPCTGTACVRGTNIHYCDGDPEAPVVCEWDSQQYSGGDQICCTDRMVCDSCVYRGHMTQFLSYTGRSGECFPNR